MKGHERNFKVKEINYQTFLASEFDMTRFCEKFEKVASRVNVSTNDGGMHVQGLFNSTIAFSNIPPACLIELGVFKGMSSAFVKEFFLMPLRFIALTRESRIVNRLSHSKDRKSNIRLPILRRL